MKTLYFEGAGLSDVEISRATIGNCRIRTAFHLDDGRRMYLEISAAERTKKSAKDVFRWRYTGFVDSLHYITDEVPNDDVNRHSVPISNFQTFEYTEDDILALVNSLGASFTEIKVLPMLGGYHVFKEKYVRGEDHYRYGDEFPYDPEQIARREAIDKEIYRIESEEMAEDRRINGGRFSHSPSNTDHPVFSLWVDENDSGLLHLVRYFIGGNKHWEIRTDVGKELSDWMATMKETPLGRYGC